MHVFRDLSIRRKLLWMALAASFTALVLAIPGFLVLDVVTFRGALVRQLSVQADIAGANAVSAIVFADPAAAGETLRALQAEPQVLGAQLYGSDGMRFATFLRPDTAPSFPDHVKPGVARHAFSGGQLLLFRPVRLHDRTVGTVALQASLHELNARLVRGSYIAVAAFVVCLLAAIAISATFERMTSRPILELAATARRVTEERDYSIRATARSGDEIGTLVGSLNQMLGEIERRDDELRSIHGELENRVAARTQELREEVAERTRAEAELAIRAEELARSNRELEQFAYVASHDLQEPLRTVTSYVQLLGRRYAEKLDGEAREFMAFAVEGTQRMQELIKDLLAFSRVGTHGKGLAETDSGQVFEQVLRVLAEMVRDRRARVTHDPLPIVLADESQLAQLFQNLLSNALKFCAADVVPNVHVSAEREGRVWRFAMRDNGIGIEPRFFDRIFTIFQRLHTRDQYSGTGIGLAVCKKIVERHGGTIWVESESGKGSTFFLTLRAPVTSRTPAQSTTIEANIT